VTGALGADATPQGKGGELFALPFIFLRIQFDAWSGLLKFPARPMSACVNKSREPIFNIPAVVVVVLAVLAIVHAGRVYLLSDEAGDLFIWKFGFVPARYQWDELLFGGWEYGWAIWTFVTYAFIHADITHLGFNAIWLLAFGSAVARRFGTARFVAFFALTSAAGAVAHLISHIGDLQPMIGASAAISGTMGAAARFAFQRGGPLDPWRPDREHAYRDPAPPLHVALRDPRVLAFLGAWFALNLLFGIGSLSIVGEKQSIAWQAHVGGFLAGLLLFSAFDPVPPHRHRDDSAERMLH